MVPMVSALERFHCIKMYHFLMHCVTKAWENSFERFLKFSYLVNMGFINKRIRLFLVLIYPGVHCIFCLASIVRIFFFLFWFVRNFQLSRKLIIFLYFCLFACLFVRGSVRHGHFSGHVFLLFACQRRRTFRYKVGFQTLPFVPTRSIYPITLVKGAPRLRAHAPLNGMRP